PKSWPMKNRSESVFNYRVGFKLMDNITESSWELHIWFTIIFNWVQSVFDSRLVSTTRIEFPVRHFLPQPFQPLLLHVFEAPPDRIGPISSAFKKHVYVHVTEND